MTAVGQQLQRKRAKLLAPFGVTLLLLLIALPADPLAAATRLKAPKDESPAVARSVHSSASTNTAKIDTAKTAKPIITPAIKGLPAVIRGPYLQCGTTNG